MRPTYDELVQGLRYLRQFAKNTDLEFWDDLLTRAEAVGDDPTETRYWKSVDGWCFWKLEKGELKFRGRDGVWRASISSLESLEADPEEYPETTADVAEPNP